MGTKETPGRNGTLPREVWQLENWHVGKQSSFRSYARAFMGRGDKTVWHGIILAFARTALILNNCIYKKEINAKITRKSLVPLLSLYLPL